jgi:uncharacterized membrane protein YfcA
MLVVFGILIGLALGLTGGGGSLLAVPILVYLIGMDPQSAVTMSLAIVVATASVGAAEAYRSQLLMVRATAFFIAGGFLGAPIGVWISNFFVAQSLMVTFGALMILVSGSMIWRSVRHPEEGQVVRSGLGEEPFGSGPSCRMEPDGKLRVTAACSAALAIGGIVAGVLSGTFGVGGGFVIVPTLMFITRMDIRRAVASSLFAITAIGVAGLAAAMHAGRSLDWPVLGLFALGGVIGMLLGRVLAKKIAGVYLQRIFAVSAAFLGVFIVLKSMGVF